VWSSSYSQTRFNIRESLDLDGCSFTGVHELDEIFLIVANGAFLGDSGVVYPVVEFYSDLEGNPVDTNLYIKEVGNYVINSEGGLVYLDGTNEYCSIGQTYNAVNEQPAGFIMGMNGEGDTTSVNLFASPYLPLYGENFISPRAICKSNNQDGSFFISSTISRPETGNDCYIQRMNPDGDVLWEYIYATNADVDQCKAMIPTEDGGVVAGVWEFNIDGNDSYLIKLDSSGTELSSTELDIQTGPINDMKFDSNMKVLIASRINSGNGEVGAIYKFNTNGELIWQVLRGEPDPPGVFQEFRRLLVSPDDEVTAGGINYESISPSTGIDGSYNTNGWLVKVDDEGTVIWDRKYHFINSPEDKHTLNDLKATSDGGYIFCGESTDQSSENLYTEGPSQQGWLVKVDEYGCLVEGCQLSDNITVLEKEGDVEYFKAGPIPAGQFLNIYQSHSTKPNAIYQLIDMNGRVLEKFPAMPKGTTMMLEVGTYSSGSYLLVLKEEGEVMQSLRFPLTP